MQRAGLHGSALVRLLARLQGTEVATLGPSIADRLGQWLSWTDAVSLASVLNGSVTKAQPQSLPNPTLSSVTKQEAECARVRAALTKAITDDREGSAWQAEGEQAFEPFRRHGIAQQRAMESAIGPLRASVRTHVARRSPELQRLAEVDAAMEQALASHERRLLGTVPLLLERHFLRLQQAQASHEVQVVASTGEAQVPHHWLATFLQDMRAVLLAELDLRLLPVEGLLQALRQPIMNTP